MFLCCSGLVAAIGSCEASQDVNTCTAAPRTTQRVRKEVRDLSAREWQAFVDAMWTMKNISTAAGQAKYGLAFRTHEYFVVKHAVSTLDSRGEQSHFGDWFINFHAAIALEFENSLLAISDHESGDLGGLPYWDSGHGNDVFSADLMGSAPGTGDGKTVIDGAFAKWPINPNFQLSDYAQYMKTVAGATSGFTGSYTGMLRGNFPNNSLQTPYVTRYGNSSNFLFSKADYDDCTTTPACWDDWYACIDARPAPEDLHTGPHVVIGGYVKHEGNGTVDHGDLEDPCTSPNDPIFFLHHTNIDRNRVKWMANHKDEASVYYGYKGALNGARCYGAPWYSRDCSDGGVNLLDVMSAHFPFSSADLGLNGDSEGLTHADFICEVGPETAPYKYQDPGAGGNVDAPTSDGDDMISGSVGGVQYDLLAFSSSVASSLLIAMLL